MKPTSVCVHIPSSKHRIKSYSKNFDSKKEQQKWKINLHFQANLTTKVFLFKDSTTKEIGAHALIFGCVKCLPQSKILKSCTTDPLSNL